MMKQINALLFNYNKKTSGYFMTHKNNIKDLEKLSFKIEEMGGLKN